MAQLIPANWKHSLENLRQEVQRTLDRWLHRRQEAQVPVRVEETWTPSFVFTGGPSLDMEETDDELIVTAELPGLDKDDFRVELSGDHLILRGEKKSAAEKKGRNYYYAERSYGAFARALPLPCEVDADKARARYKNGVLRLTLPKTERAKARRVKVKIQS